MKPNETFTTLKTRSQITETSNMKREGRGRYGMLRQVAGANRQVACSTRDRERNRGMGSAGRATFFKKQKLVGEAWCDWESRTSFVPYGRGVASAGGFALVGGTLLWLAATYAHVALGYRSAGIWAFFG